MKVNYEAEKKLAINRVIHDKLMMVSGNEIKKTRIKMP